MSIFLLDDIPFDLTPRDVLKRLHMDENSPNSDVAGELLSEAGRVAKPKAMYKVSYIDDKGDGFVVMNAIRLVSKVVRKNFDGVNRVFPYVATCGTELDEWSNGYGDPWERYLCDCIKEMTLHSAVKYTLNHIKERYRLKSMSAVNPGSLPDWPIEQQRNLFAILGTVEDSIGVRLSDSFLMIPTKSSSGIYFPAETDYENCQLCDRNNCPGRRAPYDEHMYGMIFGEDA